MKKFKFCITMILSFLLAYSPVASAALGGNEKANFNQFVKENFKGTYNDFYRNHGQLFDEQSRSLIEAWLRINGKMDLPQPQALIIKDKNGSDTLKLVFNQSGRTLTLTFTEGNYDNFDANGTKIEFGEIRNIPSVLNHLSQNDSNLKILAHLSETERFPAPARSDMLSVGQFGKLSKIQKVEYLMLLRKNMESAQAVFDATKKAKQQAQIQWSPSLFAIFHPLFASQIACAQTVAEGEGCIVAGNISVYEMDKKGLACNPFPSKYPQSFQPQPSFHDRCSGKGQGRMVACNPVLYGANSAGEPWCVDSGNQPDFTKKATFECGRQSPLFDNKKDPSFRDKRLADLERILKSFYNLKGGAADKIKDCFNKEHEIAQQCREIFEPQYKEFIKFKSDADKICATAKLPDQKTACVEYQKRAIELMTFIDGSNREVATVNIAKEGCQKLMIAKWDDQIDDCVCNTGERATYNGGNEFECPIKAANIVQVKGKKKDKCEKEDGSKSFICDNAPWIILGLGALAWLWPHGKKTPPQAKPPGTVLPPPVTGVVPGPPTTMTPAPIPTMPTPTPTLPAGEGSNGQAPGSNGNSGGTRTGSGAH